MLKRSAALLLSFFMLCAALPAAAAEAGAAPPALATTRVALVLHPASGTVIYTKGEDAPAAPSGTVKLMVALVAWDVLSLRLDEVVTVTSAMISETRGSGLGLQDGNRITVRDLFYGLLVRGANDCAQVLALLAGGTEATFVTAMNARAAALEMEGTHYVNYTGRTAAGMQTTAGDVARLAAALYQNTTLRQMASAASYRYTINGATYVMYNRNDLCGTYYRTDYYDTNATGLCYGYTAEGGAALVTYYSTPCGDYLLVLLGGGAVGQAANIYTDASLLTTYAEEEFAYRELIAGDTPCASLPVRLSRDTDTLPLVTASSLRLFLPRAAMEEINLRTSLSATSLTAPIEQGTVLGEVILMRGEEEVGRIPLVAAYTVQRSVLLELASATTGVLLSPITILLALATVATVVVLRLRRFQLTTEEAGEEAGEQEE